jgi:methyltransferase (TIGR00027 family)
LNPTQPSLTAYRAAFSRAAHQVLDHPRVFEDPVATRIIGGYETTLICASPERYLTPAAAHLRAFLVARSKYAEDALAGAIQNGVHQYVIMGAGLDTFAYRNPYAPEDLQVFEVDHPATQAWKQERLQAVGIPIPASLKFAALDFETDSLEEQLSKAGFKTAEPAFFSWLGVTMYLAPVTVMNILKSIAGLARPGSEIVFDYALYQELLSPKQLLSYQVRAERLTRVDEPWKGSFEPVRLAASLKSIGFSVEEDLGMQAINARFFQDSREPLRVHGAAHLLKAIISPKV